MTSKISSSKEILIGPKCLTNKHYWPKLTEPKKDFHEFLLEVSSSNDSKSSIYNNEKFNWTNDFTRTILRTQLWGICSLAWLLITIYGFNLPVKTTLSTDLVPLWSLWIVALYVLSLCIGYSFHFYPSCFGILVGGILQLMTLGFSSYFELIVLTAMEQNGRLDRNDTTRSWGALLYSTIIAANGAVIFSAFILIFTSFRDVCEKRYSKFESKIQIQDA